MAVSHHHPPGDRQSIVLGYLPMARRVAGTFVRPGVERDDLVQVAALGLLHAADRFDDRRGVPFEAYALLTMRGELRHYVRDACRRQQLEVVSCLAGRFERAVEDADLARIDQRVALERVVEGLDPRSRSIVRLRFDSDLTLRDIGRRLGMSESHVCRLLARALRTLAAELGAPGSSTDAVPA